jgi:hypothetical protein
MELHYIVDELRLHTGYIPVKSSSLEIIGNDNDAMPIFAVVCKWWEFEYDECCPYCGCLCGMHWQKASCMYWCMDCGHLSNLDGDFPENIFGS